MSRRFLLVLLTFCVMVSSTPAQTVLTFEPVKDNTLYEDPNGRLSNGAGIHMFAGRTNQPQNSVRRALVAFDLSEIPPGAKVESATLTLFMSRSNALAGKRSVALHRMLRDWGEGSADAVAEEGSGAAPSGGDATWVHSFFDTTLWTGPGAVGDFDPSASAALEIDSVSAYTWGPTEQMTADVQQWVDDPSSNFGWLILGDETVGRTSKRFDTREHPTLENRPLLAVTVVTTDVSDPPKATVEDFALLQNYPNPFNPTTEIRFSLNRGGHVRLEVFDLKGRRVETLVEGHRPAGLHTIRFDAGRLAAGFYFYRLTAGRQQRTRRMILVR